MKFPKKCPHCGAKWFGDEPSRSYLFVRTDLDLSELILTSTLMTQIE